MMETDSNHQIHWECLMLAPLVPLILYAWVLVVIFLFSFFPPKKALIIAVIVATLFLPHITFKGPAGIEIGKVTMTALGCLLATLIFEPDRLTSFVPGWIDLPFIVLSIWVVPSQIANGLSPVSPVINHFLVWSVPYLMGRIYLNNLDGLRQLTLGIFMGGLAYVPLCLWEGRLSPQLHLQIYGPIPGFDFGQTIRLGGYRPVVFMGHGLPVGMWMAAATIAGFWLWQFKVVKKLFNQPIYLLVIGQAITFWLVKSTGAYIYAVASAGILLTARWLRTSLLMFALVVYLSHYVITGANGQFHETPNAKKQIAINYGDDAIRLQGERGQSYWYRVRNEKLLSAHARKRLWTGWGGSGANFVMDPNIGKLTITDSLWILMYGIYGAPGLASFFLMFFLPAIGFVIRYPARMWNHPKISPVSALPIILVMYMWDSTLNGFPNAVYFIASGGICGLLSEPPERLESSKPVLPGAKSQHVPVRQG